MADHGVIVESSLIHRMTLKVLSSYHVLMFLRGYPLKV